MTKNKLLAITTLAFLFPTLSHATGYYGPKQCPTGTLAVEYDAYSFVEVSDCYPDESSVQGLTKKVLGLDCDTEKLADFVSSLSADLEQAYDVQKDQADFKAVQNLEASLEEAPQIFASVCAHFQSQEAWQKTCKELALENPDIACQNHQAL